MSPPRTCPKQRLLERRKIVGDCWIYTGSKTRDGYGVMGVGRSKQMRAHRLAYEYFVGPIPTGQLVCHRCDTRLCINPAHLFLGSPKTNTQDMIAKGRKVSLSGEAHPNSKLSNAERDEIVSLRRGGALLTDIAKRFGLSFQHVSTICKQREERRGAG